MDKEKNIILTPPPKIRLIWGGIVFVSGFLSPLLIPYVISLDLSATLTSVISGLLAIGVPEVFMLIAVAILGKGGFEYLKQKIFRLFRKYGPPDMVSLRRYRIGIILFSVNLIVALILPYILNIFPFLLDNLLLIIIIGDSILVISLFILGGDFWDKLRSLFIYSSRAVIIDKKTMKNIRKC